METKEYYGGTYPEPSEKTKTISGKVYICYEFEDMEVPKDWDIDQIEQDIKENLSEYICNSDEIIEEIEVG